MKNIYVTVNRRVQRRPVPSKAQIVRKAPDFYCYRKGAEKEGPYEAVIISGKILIGYDLLRLFSPNDTPSYKIYSFPSIEAAEKIFTRSK